MKSLAFVVSLVDGRRILDKVIDELKERNIQAELVAFDDEKVEWKRFDLIIPTAALDYIHQYEKLLKVVDTYAITVT